MLGGIKARRTDEHTHTLKTASERNQTNTGSAKLYKEINTNTNTHRDVTNH